MEQITVGDILKATGGRLLGGDPDQKLSHISIDSRAMRGDDLFVPLIGERADGHRFLVQAAAAGAAASLTSEHDSVPEGFQSALIRVDDTRKALQDIGRYLRSRIHIPLVGITGSVGKTTTREMVAAALSARYRTFKTPANHNSQIGVPLTLSEISETDEIGVLELGMSEPGEMEVIAGIAAVDTAVMTNIGVTHIENLGTRENILKEKLHIQDGMREGGVLFVNGDNDLLGQVEAKAGCRTIRYGLGKDCQYRAENVVIRDGFPSFTMVHGSERIPVTLSVMGGHNVSNGLAALAVADYYGVPLEAAARSLGAFTGFENRQQIYRSGGRTILDDTYNASPDSVRAAIRVLASLEGKRRIAVLADMKELGPEGPSFHREVGAYLAAEPVDGLITFGPLAVSMAQGAQEQAEKSGRTLFVRSFGEEEREEMHAFLKEFLQEGDAVLFKGSNSMRLGETAKLFL